MAGDWLKIRHDLREDPAVIAIAEITGLEEDHVVGKLHRIWSWADRQTIDGNAPSVTETYVDRYVNVTGFAQAMSAAGWLEITSEGIVFPNFDEHISETAKKRALTARRAKKHRAKSNAACVTVGVTKSAPKEEKRREEKSRVEKNTPTRFDPPSIDEVITYCKSRSNSIDAQTFLDFYEARGWKFKTGQPMKSWKAAVRTWETRQKENPNAESRNNAQSTGTRVHDPNKPLPPESEIF